IERREEEPPEEGRPAKPRENVGDHGSAAMKDAEWHQGHSGARFNENECSHDEYRSGKAAERDAGSPALEARRHAAVHGEKGSDGSSGRESAGAGTPIGTLTRKIQCQLTLWVSTPPRITPRVPPPELTKPQTLMALARSAPSGNSATIIDSATAPMIEPPMP